MVFCFKKVVGNWGYPVAGAMKNKLAIMSMSYGGNIFVIQTWFQNMPFRRIKAGVLKLGGMKIRYARFMKFYLVCHKKNLKNIWKK